MLIKMLTGRRMDEHSEHFNKEIKNTRKVPNRNYKAEGYNN